MKNDKKISTIWGIGFGVFLTLYSVFTLLDAFVIPSNVVKVASAQSSTDTTDSFDKSDTDSTGKEHGTHSGRHGGSHHRHGGDNTSTDSDSISDKTVTSSDINSSATTLSDSDNTYTSDGVKITLTEKRVNDTTVYVADVYLDDPSQLLSGLADDSFGRNVSETTSSIASRLGAVLAINGDYYGFRNSGYVMRNGYLYRSNGSAGNEDLVIYEDGTFEIIDEGDVTAEELKSKGAVQIYSFGPGLVIDGQVSVDEDDEVGQAMQSNPRTAIGMIEKGHYVFVVSDGRTSESAGLTLEQLAEVMQDLGCTQAYNLDGGGSTTMVWKGTVVNNPTTNGRSIKERSVSDVIYISGN